MARPVILFRKDRDNEEEYEIARKYLTVITQRTDAIPNTITIGRYSVLPYYPELEKDLKNRQSQLINSYRQHAWIAEFEYYEALKDWTFQTWTESEFPYNKHPGPFVVKGRTNSRKHQWNKLMYAETRKDASNIACELANDPHIGPQGIIYREFVPLEVLGKGLYDLPYANEWRFFFYKGHLLTYGFYWSIAADEEIARAQMDPAGMSTALQVAQIAKEYTNFYVIDIARTAKGSWMVTDVNDGQMSGLSMCNPDELYKNLATLAGADSGGLSSQDQQLTHHLL